LNERRGKYFNATPQTDPLNFAVPHPYQNMQAAKTLQYKSWRQDAGLTQILERG
jgi:hypothetical protein